MKFSREAKIGLFAVVCLAALFWGLNFLKGRNVFSRTNTYFAAFTRIDGLKPTNDILLSGYKVGTVRSIRFEEGHTGRLIVALEVEKRYPIPRNSIVKLISADIMGTKAIRLEISNNKEFHMPGDTLIASIETGLLDQVIFEMGPIKDKAESLMDALQNTLGALSLVLDSNNIHNINQSMTHLKESLNNIESITGSVDGILHSDTSKFNRMLSNVESITSNLQKNNQKIDSLIHNFAAISDTIAKSNIANTLVQADSAMFAFNQVATTISKGEGTIGMLIHNDTLYNNLEKASRNLELLLLDIKENPRRYMNVSLIDFSRTRYERERR